MLTDNLDYLVLILGLLAMRTCIYAKGGGPRICPMWFSFAFLAAWEVQSESSLGLDCREQQL